MPIIVIIGEQCHAHPINPQPGLCGDILKRPVPLVAKQLGFNTVGDEQVVIPVVVVVNHRDPRRPVTYHPELQRLVQKCRVILVGKINTGLGRHIHKQRPRTDDPVALNQLCPADLARLLRRVKMHPEVGAINTSLGSPLGTPISS